MACVRLGDCNACTKNHRVCDGCSGMCTTTQQTDNLSKGIIYIMEKLVMYALLKVVLMLGLLLLVVDDLPNSLLATGNFCRGKAAC